MATQHTPTAERKAQLIPHFSYTGAPIIVDMASHWYGPSCPRDCIDAPDFIPQGYHFAPTDGYVASAHYIRPGTYRATAQQGGAA
jgi:hypothetical protein